VVRKRTIVVISVLITFCVIGNGVVAAQMKIGYINSPKIMSLYPPAVEAQNRLQQMADSLDKELRRMQQDLIQQQQDLNKKSALLTEKAKQEKQKELEDRYQRLLQYRQEKQQELSKYESDLLKPITETINNVIQEYGKRENFDYIFDTLQGTILYAKDSYDLTDIILQELKKVKSTAKK